MKNKEFSGSLRSYLNWPRLLIILLLTMNIVIYFINIQAAIVVSIFVIAYVAVSVLIYLHYKKHIMKDLVAFGSEYAQIQKQLLDEMAVPYAMIDESGSILWMNEAFQEVSQAGKKSYKNLAVMFSELDLGKLPKERGEHKLHTVFEARNYHVTIRHILMKEVMHTASMRLDDIKSGEMYAVYLEDETEILESRQEIEDDRLVAGLIYLDNYDEALESIEDVRRSLLVALIDRKINKYIANYEGVLRKIEKDKYFVILKYKHLLEMQESRFELLEDVKTVNIGNDMAVTLSIGMGVHGGSYAKNNEYARTAIDMALGRGGDQAVLKDGDNITYYGGKVQNQGKNTRVKARVKAHALRELIETADHVLIMGHHISDVDCIGAAIGVYRAAKTSGKRAHIVLNTVSNSIKPLMERFQGNTDYEEDLFVNNEKAKQLIGANTLLVVVDTDRPSYTECPELLKKAEHIVVLDHHRQSREIIENAVLSYVEPYASSACEMVAEILQYYSDDIRIRSTDADAIYAGIVVDTNNFMNKTGVRTFEAAAFLRRNGADVTRVRKLFRDEMDDYKAKAQAVRDAEVFQDVYAIAICPGEMCSSPTVIGAQAANELLGIRGIKASFVLTPFEKQIYISARSIDEVNVQIIMEKLGGGGHLSIAGAQLKDVTIAEARAQLKDVIMEMTKHKDL